MNSIKHTYTHFFKNGMIATVTFDLTEGKVRQRFIPSASGAKGAEFHWWLLYIRRAAKQIGYVPRGRKSSQR
ncbi:MAG: hypothetical protein JWR69_2222 [Pedosphaera sp.]|nr:hypothetical protein [Pedosphaera sp.]